MALTGKIMDFFADKAMTIPAFPRTKVKAVSDDNGVGLNVLLDAKAATSHNHSASDITGGTLPVSRGGTDANTKEGILSNLHSAYPVTDYIATFGSGFTNGGFCTPVDLRNAMGAAIGVAQCAGDANAVTESGMYRLQGATNIPSSAQYGQMIVVHGVGDTIAQIAFDYDSSRMWVRTGNPSSVGGGGVWSSWQQVITTGSYFNAYLVGSSASSELDALKYNWKDWNMGTFMVFLNLNGAYRGFVGMKLNDSYGSVIELSYGTGRIFKYVLNGGTWTEYSHEPH